jgi:biotin carboxyl carrier protein
VINKVVEAPLPGIITSVKVKVGDHVKAGQVVAILDAMKMENEILTEHDGVIASVDVVPDESVLEGSTIVTLH